MRIRSSWMGNLALGIVLSWSQIVVAQTPVGTALTYQGQLSDAGNPATGIYDLQFALYDAVTEGNAIGSPLVLEAVAVSKGLFTVSLDFGDSAFVGSKRWLQIAVRPTGSVGGYTTLSPRTEMTPATSAVFSANTGDPSVQRRTAAPTCPTGQSIGSLAADGTPTCVVSGGGTVTAVTASGPLSSSGGDTPDVSLTGTVAVENGGTGAVTAAAARTNLAVPGLTGNNSYSGRQTLVPTTNGLEALVVQGVPSQTANLQEWRNSAASTLASVGPAGLVTAAGFSTAGSITAGALTGLATPLSVAQGGTGSAAQNFVDLSTPQTVAGVKTFSSPIVGSVSGGAGSVNWANIANNPVNVALLRWGAIPGGDFPIGTQPTGVAFDGANIWVTNFGSNTVTKLLASTGATLGAFPTGSGPQGLAFDGAHMWVANQNSADVTKLLASTGAVLGTYPVAANPGGPHGVAFDGTFIWVASYSSNSVTKFRASTGANSGTYPVGSGATGVAFDGTNIWVTNNDSDTVSKLLASTGAILGTFAVGDRPYAVAFDGASIWVANYGSNTVTKLLASTGAFQGTFPVGTEPVGVAFDGANVWVANFGSNNVTKLLASTGEVLGSFSTGTGSSGVAFDGVNIWVANVGSNTVSKR